MPRSLKLRQSCISHVKLSLLRNGFPSQRLLADQLEIAQSTVSHFLNGKPVDFVNFVELCQVLGQDWRDLADLETEPQGEQQEANRQNAVTVLISGDASCAELITQLQQAFTQTQHRVTIAPRGEQLRFAPTPLLSVENVQSSDYWLLLLTEQSAVSEATLANIQLAQELQKTQQPTILLILIDLPWMQQLPFDLLGYLQDKQPWQWQTTDAPTRLAAALLEVWDQRRKSLPVNPEFAISWAKITGSSSHVPVPPLPSAAPEIPGGQMDLASRFYIERPPIESLCYKAIAQPGALIRIKAPRQMGKTSLMARILHQAKQQGARVVPLSFQLANQRSLTNSDTFLQWFCASVSLELGLLDPDQLTKHWQLADLIGSNQCCKAYFEQYLLPSLSAPLTLGLDEVDRVFANLEIADDFFGLLRALHEEAKRREIWKNIRLIVVHSTEVYIPLDVNKSPFNVGLPIELPEFTLLQVEELVQRHSLSCRSKDIQALTEVIGGHPFLVRLALYAIVHQSLSFEQLQDTSTTDRIYADHLHRHLSNLERNPALMQAFRQVVLHDRTVRLPSEQAFKLDSMGLVKLTGNDVVVRCQLYRDYFHRCLN
ncbi:AAA-like domain-containing protein [Leptolyngbya sp. FACHB-671]|uniref:AAA-like domain-containing protein n=1 Tax=Leptolyngbya sp. FACHB-671 TaxID=2692812 RepID=UPI001688BB2C|nr:AAA-like domain-containing protein [Leptolyngbya sp. FACHB-671]MBD2067214.1 AAA-like domain-containing protein [Leptolyngbya sp. FACHB-671]